MYQQLDLFGGNIPQHQPKEKRVETAAVTTFQSNANFAVSKKPVIIFEDEPNYETVYESLVKRKRGRPRKEKHFNTTLKTKLKRGRKSFAEINIDIDLTNVPTDEELNKKMYYPISVVAKWFNVTNSQIRFWENEFDILKPKKNGKGDRLFRPEDIKNLKLIYILLRQKKYNIEGAKEYLKANKDNTSVSIQLHDTLQKLKYFLLELKANL